MIGDAVGNWRVDAEAGGPSRAFADIGSHWCDLAEWVSGHRVTEIVSSLQTTVPLRPPGHAPTFSAASSDEREVVGTEDVACLLRTDLGALGTLTVSQVSPGRKNRLWFEIDGDERSIVFNQERSEQLSLGATSSVTLLVRDTTVLSMKDLLSVTAEVGGLGRSPQRRMGSSPGRCRRSSRRVARKTTVPSCSKDCTSSASTRPQKGRSCSLSRSTGTRTI